MRRQSVCECGSCWPGPSRICHCEGCHRTFTGVKAFDVHRRGRGIDRRCVTSAEMLALGLRQNLLGRWYCPAGSRRRPKIEVRVEPPAAA